MMSEQRPMNDLAPTTRPEQPATQDPNPLPPSAGNLVTVDNLAIDFATSFGAVSALRGVSFNVKYGEGLGIVGESGSGKTVACRAILKLLDVNVQAQILDLLGGIRPERNISIILVSHDLGVIAEMCDRVVVMKDGAVVEVGTVDEILRSPQDDYTKRLIASQPSLLQPMQQPAVITHTAAGAVAAPHLRVSKLDVRFYPGQSLGQWLLHRPPQIVRAAVHVSFSLRRGGACR